MPHKVYILDDDASFAKLVAANLGQAGEFNTRVFTDPELALEGASEELPDAFLTDLRMPGLDGIEVTKRLKSRFPHLPVFILTAVGEIDSAVEALKAGADEYLTKPPNVSELTTQLRRAIKERPILEEVDSRRRELRERYSPASVLGEHPRVEETRQFIRQVAAAPTATVLLMGESGTGKNLVAQAIHYAGERSGRRFVEINCSALPPQLLEAELFGFMKGSFTDARESKRGLAEVADGGTLFLDEIADLPLDLQAKLLNFLESRRFRRIGGTEEIEVDLRLVTATNRDFSALIEDGGFREDLYYRIRVATHTLPPLREIPSDIPALADHFRTAFNREFRKEITSISSEALEVLRAWGWPGNVRELRNVMERAMIFAEGPELVAGDLPVMQEPGSGASAADGLGFDIPRGLTLKEAEREYISRTLEAFGGDVQRSAEVLGISRKNLWEKRKRYGLLE